ncbi:MAG: acetylglutamate kinase [Acidobacteria bacterium]|nr:MAG: acetylglutamate kinase [Acidobacteriota bacterium]
MNGRVKVIKLGGSLLEDASRRAVVLRGIAASWKHGERIVLVHGGGKHIDAQLAKLGIPKRTHAGLRVTDDVTLPVVVAVLAGTVNKMLVSELIALGIRAAGISGSDGQTLTAEHHPPIGGVNLGHVGRVTKSDPTLLRAILGAAILPVVSSVAAAPNGSLLNVNADAAASSIAVAAGASSLVFLTDVAGLLDENGAVVSSVDPSGDCRQRRHASETRGGARGDECRRHECIDRTRNSDHASREPGSADNGETTCCCMTNRLVHSERSEESTVAQRRSLFGRGQVRHGRPL